MDQNRLAAVTRSLTHFPSRRDVLRGLVAAGLGLVAARLPESTEAGKTRKKPRRNAFGCVNVGGFCRNAGQCCSGICQGKKGKKRCKAHDVGGCRAGSTPNACAGEGGQDVACTASGGFPGVCYTTTGNAGYCGARNAMCRECARDEECEALFGAGAACVQCHDDCLSPACVGIPGL